MLNKYRKRQQVLIDKDGLMVSVKRYVSVLICQRRRIEIFAKIKTVKNCKKKGGGLRIETLRRTRLWNTKEKENIQNLKMRRRIFGSCEEDIRK